MTENVFSKSALSYFVVDPGTLFLSIVLDKHSSLFVDKYKHLSVDKYKHLDDTMLFCLMASI